ncbi:MAG: hypothetical protein GXO45_05580, partial [Aquificae bacterium]|nr:hypothetical protein [Aquificota bacterium]
MVKIFEDLADEYGEGNKSAVRALQAWIYLIGKASNKQLVTYSKLASVMGYRGASALSRILGYIMYFCEENDLPPLIIIIVNKKTGIPGEGFISVN